MKRPAVLFYQRRARQEGNYSLESIFQDVRTRLENDIDSKTRIAPACSNGCFRRLWIVLHAWWHQSGITHLTGDIHFAALLLNRRNSILTIHDCSDLTSRQGIRAWIQKLLWFKLPIRRVARVTTVSAASKRDIVTLTGCDEQMIDVVPVAVSQRFVRVEREFHQQCPTVLQVGCAWNKNIERLAAALAGLPCRLCVIGQLSDAQLAAIREADVRLETHAKLSEDEVIGLYAACDIVAFASTYEGFGMPIIEGQAVGRVVVTSDCSSMPEVAGDGACLVNPLDVRSIRAGIERVINDTDYRESLIARGFENKKRFDPDVIARQYLKVYHEIASEPQLDSATGGVGQ